MSILGTIVSKVLGHAPTPPAAKVGTTGGAGPSVTPSASTTSQGAASSVDVGTVLDALNDKATQKLDWRHSIVDLLKLLSLDSSLAARKDLAKELHYDGDTNNSASMNIWLHKQVMVKLAENGGKLPDDLKH
jgi:Domain of unknown function (DUF3597)